MRILAFLLLAFAATAANALPTVEDVQHAVHRGDYSAAQSLVREVIAAKPDNARAHYILAELLAHQGQVADAKAEAALAQRLDPDIHFTTPERFRQFQTELGVAPSASRAAASPVKREETSSLRKEETSGGSTGLWLLLALGAGAVFLFARRRPNVPPGYTGNYSGAPNGMPGAPGFGAGVPVGNPPGIGSTVVAGLGGVAAGMVAEHLIEEAMGHHHAQDSASPNFAHPSSESVEDRPIDFGNGSDWAGGDSGGSGGDSGGGFDSGSGGDWS